MVVVRFVSSDDADEDDDEDALADDFEATANEELDRTVNASVGPELRLASEPVGAIRSHSLGYWTQVTESG